MKTSEQLDQLATALAKAQADMKPAVKDSANPFFKSRYADLASVIEASTAALSAHGLSISSLTDTDAEGNMTLCTYLLHASGQWMCSHYAINPVKPDPQSVGSAISYARRYAIMSICNLATADDDAEAAMGRNDDRQPAPPPSRRQTRHNHTPDMLPQAWKETSPAAKPAKRAGRPMRQEEPQVVDTSNLYQEVVEQLLEARSLEELTAIGARAMKITDEFEKDNARAAYLRRKEQLAGASERSDAARDAIKASLPKPA